MPLDFSHTPAGTRPTLWIARGRVSIAAHLPGTGVSLIEVTVPPGSGVPLHSHSSPEAFHMLEGELAFATIREGRRDELVLRSGDSVAVASRLPHGFSNPGRVAARFLALVDESLLAFFLEVGSPAPQTPGPPSADLLAAAQRHGMTFHEPPS